MTLHDPRCLCCPQGFTVRIGSQLLCVSPHQPRVTYQHSCLGCDAPIPNNRIFCDACDPGVSNSDPAHPPAGVTAAADRKPSAVVVTSFSCGPERDSVGAAISHECPKCGRHCTCFDDIVSALEAEWSRSPKSVALPTGSQAVAASPIRDLEMSAAVDGACAECAAFLMRRNITTFRVAAASAIHSPASSSHIPNS